MQNLNPRIYAVVPYLDVEKGRYIHAVWNHLHTFMPLLSPLSIPWRDRDERMLVNESAWRSAMLREAVELWRPWLRDGIDWILVNDADEFIVSTVPEVSTQDTLDICIRSANENGIDSLTFGLDELWSYDPPLIRTDKTWAGQRMLRMFRYCEGMPLVLPNKKLACGSIPEWARNNSMDCRPTLRVLHAGYADASERPGKFARYEGRPEHGSAHVQSIMDEDVTLKGVTYECPEIWRGSRNERALQG